MTTDVPVVGRTYLLDESDYRYGRGPLVCTVVRIIQLVDYYGAAGRVEPWWLVDGVCAYPDLTGPGTERALYLRAGSLRGAHGRASVGPPPRA